MPATTLADRTLVEVSGPEAEHFLQTIITTDLDTLESGVARAGALLTPQGKILFDFVVSRAGPERFRLDCRADAADDLVKRLTLYKLRAKVEIAKNDQAVVSVSWETDSTGSHADSAASRDESDAVADGRFVDRDDVRRHYGAAPGGDDADAWQRLRIAHAVAESGADFALGEAFPHDVLYDRNGGVGLKKGCFVGQEVVSRMQHRGTARRRLAIAGGAAALPAAGSPVTAGGRAIGTLGTVAGADALALVRIDRAAAAMQAGTPIEADGVAVTLALPAWSGLAFAAGETDTEAG
ncbi:folate-binding protein YgfZ [Aquibium sp. A9E412]|uniref:CAF17-like 4Fe-4S cluster assembly/insertion protein YgfZ n=1 Tax=Aquibium sp. A9E412 TaxID=2976767 RepID=UPI0025B19F5A|nr:folate-binding protein YgfZ [Aquibium sp. A9E412]MDN2567160.1 folate-binding protein YgfZ [Aquibium sp. A9E412]